MQSVDWVTGGRTDWWMDGWTYGCTQCAPVECNAICMRICWHASQIVETRIEYGASHGISSSNSSWTRTRNQFTTKATAAAASTASMARNVWTRYANHLQDPAMMMMTTRMMRMMRMMTMHSFVAFGMRCENIFTSKLMMVYMPSIDEYHRVRLITCFAWAARKPSHRHDTGCVGGTAVVRQQLIQSSDDVAATANTVVWRNHSSSFIIIFIIIIIRPPLLPID